MQRLGMACSDFSVGKDKKSVIKNNAKGPKTCGSAKTAHYYYRFASKQGAALAARLPDHSGDLEVVADTGAVHFGLSQLAELKAVVPVTGEEGHVLFIGVVGNKG